MVATEQAVENGSAIPDRSRRKTPEEIEGFQGVVLSPGGKVDVLNISNSGILVETVTRTKPGLFLISARDRRDHSRIVHTFV